MTPPKRAHIVLIVEYDAASGDSLVDSLEAFMRAYQSEQALPENAYETTVLSWAVVGGEAE